MSGATPPLLTWILALAFGCWRIFGTWKVAHEASRRWRLVTALRWALLLLVVDLVAVVLGVAAQLALADLNPARSGPVATALDNTATGLVAAIVLSSAARRVPWPFGIRKSSLERYIVTQIEYACYETADAWIYREVYPTVGPDRTKPFMNEIRGYLENQPGVRGSLDGSYIGDLNDADYTPTVEDLRAACHRLLTRSGRRALMRLVAVYRTHGRKAPPVHHRANRDAAADSAADRDAAADSAADRDAAADSAADRGAEAGGGGAR